MAQSVKCLLFGGSHHHLRVLGLSSTSGSLISRESPSVPPHPTMHVLSLSQIKFFLKYLKKTREDVIAMVLVKMVNKVNLTEDNMLI